MGERFPPADAGHRRRRSPRLPATEDRAEALPAPPAGRSALKLAEEALLPSANQGCNAARNTERMCCSLLSSTSGASGSPPNRASSSGTSLK